MKTSHVALITAGFMGLGFAVVSLVIDLRTTWAVSLQKK
jgi:hypothetical protein